METMTCAEVRQMLVACTDKIIRNEPYLTRLDSAIGDGDHGVGMLNGMKAAKACLQDSENETNVYALYTKMSAAMQQAMGGASGMIFSTLFAGDAELRAPSQALTPALLAQQMAAGLQAIQDLGHATPGDKDGGCPIPRRHRDAERAAGARLKNCSPPQCGPRAKG